MQVGRIEDANAFAFVKATFAKPDTLKSEKQASGE